MAVILESCLKRIIYPSRFADILSVLSMTNADQEERACLKYRLVGSGGEVGDWGHEYVRHLSGR